MKANYGLTSVLAVGVLMFSAFIPVQPVAQDSTPEPEATITPVEFTDGFAGNWIAYYVVPLKPGANSGLKPGIRLKITPESYSLGEKTCTTPKYSIKITTREEFLQGNPPPKTSLDFYENKFSYLSTGCAGFEPAEFALASFHSLAALVNDELVFFEPDASLSVGGIDVKSDLVFETSEDPKFEIHGQVPVIQSDSAAVLNALLKKSVMDELDGFKKNFKDWEIPPEMADQSSFMWINYDVSLLTPRLASLRFNIDFYMAGAAHPNHIFKVVNFDIKEGKSGTFAGLFTSTPKALTFLSKYCKNELNKPDFPLFEEGLEPKEENFQNWNLTEKGLRLSFAPYDVAPYAAGPQEVLIPFSELHSLVNSADGFGSYIAQN
jgi:hypothetical protein